MVPTVTFPPTKHTFHITPETQRALRMYPKGHMPEPSHWFLRPVGVFLGLREKCAFIGVPGLSGLPGEAAGRHRSFRSCTGRHPQIPFPPPVPLGHLWPFCL